MCICTGVIVCVFPRAWASPEAELCCGFVEIAEQFTHSSVVTVCSNEPRGQRDGSEVRKNLFHSPTPLMSGCRCFWEIWPKIAPYCLAPMGLYTKETTGDLLQQSGPALHE